MRVLRKAGVALSDRRVVKIQRLVAAAAALDGRAVARASDLWPIVYALPTQDAQLAGRAALEPLLAEAQNASLPAAALDASRSGAARAVRLAELATELLDGLDGVPLEPARRARLEGVARDIDASFDVAKLPAELSGLRARELRPTCSSRARRRRTFASSAAC